MTERLYYRDAYLTHFDAEVVEALDGGRRIYLNRSAFYPASGGQPFDIGMLGGVPVVEVVDEEERIAHILERPLSSTHVAGEVDWQRRYDHMQQHTGQHLLSAVLEDLFGIATVSFHLGAEVSTIDVKAATLSPAQIEQAETRCAELATEARPVAILFEDASEAVGLRKESERTGKLRIVSIPDFDRSACGGTHVRTTAETAPILIRKLDKVRDTARLEFVCGQRARKRASQDYRVLSTLGRTLAVGIDVLPAAASALSEKNKQLEKSLGRVAMELARREGAELYASAAPDARGLHRLVQRGPIDEAGRTRAQAFIAAGPKAIFLVVCDDPASVLLACSADSGIHAGDCVKAAVAKLGGRGGGNQNLAQGSAPNAQALLDALEIG